MLYKQLHTIFTALFLFVAIIAFGQQSLESSYPELFENKTFIEAERQFREKADFEQAEVLYAQLYRQLPQNKLHLKAYTGLRWVYTLYNLHRTEKALTVLAEIEKNLSEEAEKDQLLLADLYTYKAKVYAKKGKIKEAVLFNDKAMIIKEAQYPPLHPTFGESYVIYTYIYSYFDRDIKKVADYMAKEQAIVAAHPEAYSVFDKIIFYYNLTNLYSDQGQHLKAATQGKRTINLLETLGSAHHGFLSKAYTIVGNLYTRMEDPLPAIQYYEEALAFPVLNRVDSTTRAITYTNIGAAYTINDQFDRSVTHYKKALSFYDEDDKAYRAYTLFKIGENYIYYPGLESQNDHLDSGFVYLQQSLDLFNTLHPGKHYSLGAPYSTMGRYHSLKGEHEAALSVHHQALIRTLPDFNDPDPYHLPSLQQCINGYLIETILAYNAEAIFTVAQQNNDKQALQTALDAYKLIDSIYYIKRKYSNDESTILNDPKLHDYYGLALGNLHDIYQQDKKAAHLQQVFQYMERVKGIVLMKNLANMKHSELFGVPDSLIKKVKRNAQEINSYLLAHPDYILPHISKQLSTNDTLFQLLQQKDELEAVFKNNFPQYHQARYQSTPLTLDEVQKKLSGQSLLEYYWTDQYLFVLYINDKDIQYHQIFLDAPLLEKIKTQIDFLKGSSLKEEDFQLYQQNAYDLYLQLLHPLFRDKIPERLVIIPDGPLASIPFETLVTTKSEHKTINYLNLPYLVKSSAISYAYSTATLLQAHSKSNLLAVPKMLAFSFTDKSDFESGNKVLEKYNLSPLSGAAAEVESLSKIMPANNFKAFYGKAATREAFFETYPEYNLLHLAIHAQSDQKNRFNNRIFFHPKDDSDSEDFICYAHELYDLKPHPRMVVLGACNTGSGMNYKGEGIYSTARGFIYAGTPSVVMSSWPLSDQASKLILSDFYITAFEGTSLDLALQQAKLSFLKDADEWTAHPSKWAALNIIGSTKPIVQKSWNWLYIGMIAALLLFVPLMWFFYKRQSSIL